jgi:hypothetical protein
MENFMKELTGFTMKKVFNYIRSKNVFDIKKKLEKESPLNANDNI